MEGCAILFLKEVKSHLEDNIIPFWKGLRDLEFGGYYGFLDYNLNLDKKAVKGVILHSRILWFFSNAYKITKDIECLEHANHCYQFILEKCFDKENGGVYWWVTYDGSPSDTTKHTYNQAFAVYALASYYSVTQNKEALRLAFDLFTLIETKLRDELLYLEAFDRYFNPIENDKLSENGLMASKTMNTLLHLLEAYTELYKVSKDENVKKRLIFLLEQFESVVYNKERRILEVFFDKDMKTLSDLNSYGHDIEASWLMDLACEVLGDEELTSRIRIVTDNLREHIYEEGFVGDSLNNESFRGEVDTTKIWWVQAEALLGFLNGYELDRNKDNYLLAVKKIWDYIKEYMVDKRSGSEWFYDLDDKNIAVSKKEIVGPWKCPYHNGRMCFEILKRNIDIT